MGKKKIPKLIIDFNNYEDFISFMLTADFSETIDHQDYYCLISGKLKSCLNSETCFAEQLEIILKANDILDCIEKIDIWEWFCNEFEENFYLFELGFLLEHFGFDYNFENGKYIIQNEKLLNSFNQFLKDQE